VRERGKRETDSMHSMNSAVAKDPELGESLPKRPVRPGRLHTVVVVLILCLGIYSSAIAMEEAFPCMKI
jgi:hypothetical protein